MVRCTLAFMSLFLHNLSCCRAFSPSASPFSNFRGEEEGGSSGGNNNPDAFSFSSYQKTRSLETSRSLDSTRFHFQILFVDNDNAKGRIAEGLLARVAEYNDAMVVLFPGSSTITNAQSSPTDAAAPEGALHVCASLGLCSFRSEEIGTAFSLSFLDEYDLVIAMDEDIRSLILRSVTTENADHYAQKCKALSEFLNLDFCGSTKDALLDMLEPDLRERSEPFSDVVHSSIHIDNIFRDTKVPVNPRAISRIIMNEQGAAVPNTMDWPVVEASMILASAGITRFCLDTIDFQFNAAFETLLERNMYKKEHLEMKWETVDEQLGRCNASVCGYFSPKQRKEKFDQYYKTLQEKIQRNNYN